MLRNLRKEFAVAVGAGEAAIRIDTDEIHDCISTLTEVCKKHGWELRVFDALVGTQWLVGADVQPQGKKPADVKPVGPIKSPSDLLAAVGGGQSGGPQAPPNTVQALLDFYNEPAKPDKTTQGEVMPVVMVVKNFHLGFERNREMMCTILQHIVGDKISDHPQYNAPNGLKKSLYDPHEIPDDSDTGKFVVGLMPAEARIPPEVAPLFKNLVHELPDEEELAEILRGSCPTQNEEDAEDNAQKLPPEVRRKICKFALGLTRLQAEGVFAASMVQFGTVDPEYVWKEKSQILNKEGLVELYQGKEKFKDVAGLEGMKDYIIKLLTPDEFDDGDPDVRAKGLLACGPPGTGKSLIAKAAGNELGLPILMVNPGNWFGQYVGESEAKTRKGFQILRAHAPCVAIIDEVEKVMPSSRSAGGDSGVGARMEGTFLTMMNDLQELIFWMFTANDVRRMHEAFFRAERVDGVFYVRLPGAEQRAALWKLYGRKFFPETVMQGKQEIPFPRHLSTSVKTVLEELKKAKKVQPAEWANKFVLALMCVSDPKKREEWMERIKEANENVFGFIKLINDDGWSPAEIRSCCRLSRRLKEPLTKTQMRIRPVKVSAAKVIEFLEEWAEEAALDAETGELYVPVHVETDENEDSGAESSRVKKDAKKVKRKVRKVD
jgi:SpoVK/Ycf46/Vps4 family AAA+-type ATPase